MLANWDKHGEWFFWAPHVIRHEGLSYMFVCVGDSQGHQYKIHLLTSKDLSHCERSPANPLLTDGFDARDPYVPDFLSRAWHFAGPFQFQNLGPKLAGEFLPLSTALTKF